MANVRFGTTFYIDTQYAVAADELMIKNLKVKYIILTATAANGRIVLTDSGNSKFDLRVAISGKTEQFDFSQEPIVFSLSLRPTTLSNAVATVCFEETRS